MKKISTKLLSLILPVMTVGLFIVVVTSCYFSVQTISSEVAERMQETMEAGKNEISMNMKTYEKDTTNVALTIGQTLTDATDLTKYEAVMEHI